MFQENACNHLDGKGRHLFGSPQCLGYRFEYGDEVTRHMCFPDDDLVVNQVVAMVKKTGVKSLFVATDSRDLIEKFKRKLKVHA